MISVVQDVYDTCGSPFSFFLVANFSFFCSIFLYTDVTNLCEKKKERIGRHSNVISYMYKK